MCELTNNRRQGIEERVGLKETGAKTEHLRRRGSCSMNSVRKHMGFLSIEACELILEVTQIKMRNCVL